MKKKFFRVLLLPFIMPFTTNAEKISIEQKFAQYFAQPALKDEITSPDFSSYTYSKRDNNPLQLFVFSDADASGKSQTKAAILLFHSGGWIRGRPEWLFGLAKKFAQQGLVAIPVQYRLSNEKTTPIDALTDACDAFRWVRENAAQLQIDPNRIAGWGASAGGYLAAATTIQDCSEDKSTKISGTANALILVSAGTDPEQSSQFRRLVGEGIDLKRYSPIAQLKAGAPATLIISGEEDSVTPLSGAKTYCDKIQSLGSQCSLVSYPNLGHLLTRDLDDQRSNVNPDPEKEELAYHEQQRFLKQIGYIPNTSN